MGSVTTVLVFPHTSKHKPGPLVTADGSWMSGVVFVSARLGQIEHCPSVFFLYPVINRATETEPGKPDQDGIRPGPCFRVFVKPERFSATP